MPLFMSISGFLFFYHSGIKYDYIDFIKKKAFRLIIPYVVISSLAFVPKVILSRYAQRPIDLSIDSFARNVFFPWDNAIIFFWFLPTLFIIFAISPLLRASSNLQLCMTTMVLCMLHFFNPLLGMRILNLEGVVSYLIYFWVGCLMAQFWKKFESGIFSNRPFIILFFIITVVLNTFEYRHPLLSFVTAISGIAMSFGLSQIYSTQKCSFLDFMSGYSYQIYLLSWFPQTFFNIMANKILHLGFYPSALLMFIGGLVIPLLCAKVVQTRNYRYKEIIGM